MHEQRTNQIAFRREELASHQWLSSRTATFKALQPPQLFWKEVQPASCCY